MKGDEISLEAKKDLLIVYFGDSYLKKHKKERMIYACSVKMRELSRLLLSYRKIVGKTNIGLKDILHPKNFDTVLHAARTVVGYDPEKNTFQSPSLAMHFGTTLKMVCDELTHLIIKEKRGFKCNSLAHGQEWLRNIKNFKRLIESRWNTEMGSLANKDLLEKRWKKPLLLPLVSDIRKFRDECMKIANECERAFLDNSHDVKIYSQLVQCTLSLLIIFNRRRIGDVQFLKISDYKNEKKSDYTDFQNVLTKTEKMLTAKYKRVVNSGKGSREVVILVPQELQHFIDVLLQHRDRYISSTNDYMFALPGSKVPWGKGDVAIRTLANKMNLQNKKAMTSNKLRKQIATVTQLLNLSPEESKQFSTFMGHTEKTHKDFYE